FLPSIAFTWIHHAAARAVNATSIYEMRFDWRAWTTFKNYLIWAAGQNPFYRPTPLLRMLWPWGTILLLGALAAFALVKAVRGKRAGLFFAVWFLIVLLPVVPLVFHLSEYYLTLPTIGLAMLGGWAFADAWESPLPLKIAAVALLAVYVSPLRETRREVRQRFELSRRIERVVLGVEEAHHLHPDQIILLRDVDDDLFWQGILDRPFDLIGAPDVYLTPETEKLLTPHRDVGDFEPFIMPAAAVLNGLNAGKIVVYSASGERLQNITAIYAANAKLYLRREVPRRLDVTNDLLANLLGPG